MDFDLLEESEIMLTWLFIFGAAWLWIMHYAYLFRVNRMVYQRIDFWLLALVPVGCVVGMWWAIARFGDAYVQEYAIYQLFYALFGATWLFIWKWSLPVLGISLQDDGLQRRNTGAAIALSGAFIGVSAAFVGGNIGDGPGWWIVLLCAVTSTAALLLAWLTLELFTQISETITIDRSLAAGIRLAAFLIVTGVILGRSVSGDWIDMEDFVVSFVTRAWPVLPLIALAVFIERIAKPTVERPQPSTIIYGVFPIVMYVTLAVVSFSVVLQPAARL